MKRRTTMLGAVLAMALAGLAPRPGVAANPDPDPDPESEGEVEADASPTGWVPRRGKNLLHYSNLVGVRLNPLGLVDLFRVGYRRMLWSRRGALFEDTYLDAKLHAFLNPAFVRVGPAVDILPLAILQLGARYTYTAYTGTFGSLQSFTSTLADAAPSTLRANQKAGLTYVTDGHVVTLEALLQAKFHGVAVRNGVTAQWSKLELREGDTVFFEQTFDVLVPNGSWVLVNDADLFYLFDNGLTVGARYTLTHAFYERRHFESGQPRRNPNTPHHRVGPALLYTFFERPGARFDNLTLLLLAQWWVKHRYRTGQDRSAAMPYLVLGLQFDGQLLPLSPRHPYGPARRARKRSRAH